MADQPLRPATETLVLERIENHLEQVQSDYEMLASRSPELKPRYDSLAQIIRRQRKRAQKRLEELTDGTTDHS